MDWDGSVKMLNPQTNTMQKLPVKVYSKKELRTLYGISRETFNVWISKVKYLLPYYSTHVKILTPAQVKVLFEAWGEPEIPEKSPQNTCKTDVKPT